MTPAIGAMNIGAIVHGRILSPLWNGEYACMETKNCASRKIDPNIPKNIRNEAVFARAKPRERKKRIGSIGARARSSQATKPASSAAPTASDPTISRLSHPWPFPRTRPQTIPNSPALASATPGRSRRPAGPRLSSSRRSASGTRTRPIGTFSQKIHCQAMPSTTAPPTSGPNAIARPPIPPQAPRASARRSGATAALSSVSVSGITIAPPSPCAARAAFSASTDGASAAPTDPRVKIPSPIVNMRRRPNRSPSAAPVSRKTANVSVYAFTVHSSCSSDASRSVRITGSAVVTTRLSSETMNSATEVIANVQRVRALPFIGDPPRSLIVTSHS